MKRGQDDAGLSPNKAEKMPKYITDALSDLPDDEFKLVLGFLDNESKQNLKLTNKDNEKRVMQLDPSMREWKLVFNDNNWDTLGMSLSKARIRHTEDGSIHDIKISLEFLEFYRQDLFYSIMFLMDSVITHWRNNIVSLGICMTGYEIFLLDKKLFMPQLKHLVLNGSTSSNWTPKNTETSKDSSKIVSILLQNHAETLEHLELLENIDASLTHSLQIKRFDAINISPQMIASVLKLSQSNLEVFVWQSGENGSHNVDMETETYFKKQIKSLSLKLKVFDVTDINASLVSSVINASHKTLEHLELNAQKILFTAEEFNLEQPLFKLSTFFTYGITRAIVVSVLESSHSSLRNLKWTNDILGGSGVIPSKIRLKLEWFSAENIALGLISSVIQSTQNTLKDLTLKDLTLSNIYDDQSFHLDQLQLERFEGENIDIEYVNEVIKSSQASLKVLILDSISSSMEGFMTNTELKIHSLTARDISINCVASLIKAAQSTLNFLELEKIELSYGAEPPYMLPFDPKKSEIKFLYVKEIPASLVAELLKYTHLSLEDLSLDEVNNDEFNINSLNLSLKRFYGESISLGLLTSVLQCSQTPFKLLSLEKIFVTEGKNYNGQQTEIDPNQLKSLIKFQFQNPDCVLEI